MHNEHVLYKVSIARNRFMLSLISFEDRLIILLEENFISQGTNCTLFSGQVLTKKLPTLTCE